jgi:hypothetical protein
LSDYWVGTTDVEGNVTFPSLVTSELGEYEILASAENGVPVSGTIEAVPGSAGGVQLGAPVYPCFSELEVLAADAHLAGAGEIEVLITSDLGDEEGVVLVEVGDGLFHGAVPSEPGEEAVSDGFLQVTHGSLIAVWYYDEDDGLDASGWVSDTAAIDCQAPAFEGLASARTGLGCAELEWGAGLDPSGSVTYNIYRAEGAGPVSGEAMANTWALFYPDCDVGQGRTYTYLVRAVDAVGNEDENPVELTVSIHGIFLPLLMRE